MTSKIGRYEVLGHIAQGGMAEILLCRLVGESGFERLVVVKRIRADLDREELARFFLDEARVVARVRHSNVVDVEDLGKDEDGSPYIVMEYVDGESLSNVSRRLVARNEKWPHALVAFVVAQACAGLHAAHDLQDANGNPLNLVHRDVSPQNILVGYDGTVKVADFGIAKTSENEDTDVNHLRGKCAYMAPEQLTRGRLDRRTDVFALGIVLYELATGHRLFKKFGLPQTTQAVLKDPIVPPERVEPSVPASIAAVCMRALARPLEERYASAADMRRDLLAALRGLDCAEPETELARLMRDCFADRIEEKKGLIRNVREGSVVSRVPAGDVDITIEIPGIDEESTMVKAAAPDAQATTSRAQEQLVDDAPAVSERSGSTMQALTTTRSGARERRSAALWAVPLALVAAGVAAFLVRSAMNETRAAVAVAPPTASSEASPPEALPASAPAFVIASSSASALASVAAPIPSPHASDPQRRRGRAGSPPTLPPTATPQATPETPPPAPSASGRGFRRFQ
ncbi:MAG TPA: serine/threonine-protein kinase [Labilithrix sp.]